MLQIGYSAFNFPFATYAFLSYVRFAVLVAMVLYRNRGHEANHAVVLTNLLEFHRVFPKELDSAESDQTQH
jgi:hypothetical protein